MNQSNDSLPSKESGLRHGDLVAFVKWWHDGDTVPDGWAPLGSFNRGEAMENQRLRAAISDGLRALNSKDTNTAVRILHAALTDEKAANGVWTDGGKCWDPMRDPPPEGQPAETRGDV
jgi:hypothetical protein